MITELALAVASATVAPIHLFNARYFDTKSNFAEATILVDPAPVPQVQSGWLGVTDNGPDNFLQCGWAIGGTFGSVPVEFCQMWKDGNYSTVVLDQVPVGSSVTVGLSTDGRGQWELWVERPNQTWTVAWMGMSVLTPANSECVVATEAYAPAAAPALNYRMGG